MPDILGLLSGVKEVVAAIQGLTLGGGTTVVEAPNVTVRPNITVNCSCCSVGTGGAGVSVEQPVGEDGGTPPPGTTEPDPAIIDRKCKVANILASDMIAYTAGMENAGFFNWALDYTTLGSMLNSLSVGLGLLLIESSMTIGGWLVEMATWLFSSTPGGPSISQTLTDYREDIVCALYNATNADDARNEAITASTLTGDSAAYLQILLNNNALNLLFFAAGNSEALIDAYSGGSDCAGCVEGSVSVTMGTLCGVQAGTITQQTGDTYTIESSQSQWSCSPASPVQTIIFYVNVASRVSIIAGDRTFDILGTTGLASNLSFASYWGASTDIAAGGVMGLHEYGTSPFTVTLKIEAI